MKIKLWGQARDALIGPPIFKKHYDVQLYQDWYFPGEVGADLDYQVFFSLLCFSPHGGGLSVATRGEDNGHRGGRRTEGRYKGT